MCEEGDTDDECCTCCSRQCADRCFVITVAVQMAIGLVSYWTLIVVPWRWYASSVGVLNVMGLHLVFALMVLAYYRAITTSPGFADKHWVPDNVSQDVLDRVMAASHMKTGPEALSDFDEPRYCMHCRAFKPPRAHHCRDLNACVLKMDHYCPWIYNAVGYRNHKLFILFLLYATMALSYFLGIMYYRLYHDLRYSMFSRGQLVFSVPEIVGFAVNTCLTLPVTIGIASLFFYQLSITRLNQTSIEEYTDRRYKKLAKRKGYQGYIWFYDYGWRNNFRDMFGDSVWDWWRPEVPRHVRTGSGTAFRTHKFVFETPPPHGAADVGVVVQSDGDEAAVQRRAGAGTMKQSGH